MLSTLNVATSNSRSTREANAKNCLSRYFPSRALLAVAISSAISHGVLAAQVEDAQEGNIQALVIYGDTYRNTGTKSALEPEETPQGISVVGSEQIALRGANSIGEAMRYTPGVDTELRGSSVTRQDWINIRGFRNNQNFYDGLQLLYNDWNSQPQIDAAAIEKIEVFKGPTSVLYGSMAPGGMVNIIAKRPSSESANSIELSTGSHQLRQGSISSQGSLAGREDLSYTFTGLARNKDSQAVTAEEERYLVAGAIDWQLSDKTLLNFNLYHQQDPSAGINSTLPAAGTVYSNPNGELPVDSYSGDANWNVYDRDVTLLGYKINHQFNDDWTFLQNARYMDAKALQKNTYSGALQADNRTVGRNAYLTDEVSRGFTIDNQLSGRVMLGETEHNLLFGVDYQKLKSDIKYEDAVVSSIDLYSPNHYQLSPSMVLQNTAYSSDFRIDREQIGVYLQDQVRLDNWVFIAGLRHDTYENTETGRKYGGPVDTKVRQSNVSGRIGALYNFDNGIAPFISYSTSFEPVGGIDRNGNLFDPATSNQWEAGLKYAPLGTEDSFTLSAFRITKENELTRDPNGGPYDQIQTGEMQSQGFEFEASKQLTDQLSLDLAATVLDIEITKDNDGLSGNNPVWVPEKTASLWANYTFAGGKLNGSRLGAGVRYVGETQLDASNSNTLPGFTLVDVAMNVDLAAFDPKMQGASVNLAVNNLFDKRNVSCFDANNCWFGAERSLELSFKYDF